MKKQSNMQHFFQASILFVTILYCGHFATAQQAIITGTAVDKASGETLPGAGVMLVHPQKMILTDFDGVFEMPVDAGTYTLKFFYDGYDTLLIKDIKVLSKDTVSLAMVELTSQTSELKDVVISGRRITNTENYIFAFKQKSLNVVDGMSAAQFRKTGDSDAGSAMRRIPGISIIDNKYIYVRGIGDRYNKTLLNGMEIPGLDPDKNSVQIDLFPTKIIDNIIVYKSASADLPADFSGGLTDIGLNNIPAERTGSVSFSLAYNPNYHFRKDYLTYKTSTADYFAFGSKSREIPAESNIPFFTEVIANPNGEKATRYKDILAAFNPNLAAFKAMSFMDFGIDLNQGNSFRKEKYTIGYNFSLSYKNQTQFFEDAIYSRYGLANDRSVNELEIREYQKGNYGKNETLLSGMAGFTISTVKSRFSINLLHLQNGESTAGIFNYDKTNQGTIFSGIQHNLEYTQRALSNVIVSGGHRFTNETWKLNWSASSALSSIQDPDIRFTRYQVHDDGTYSIGTESGFPERIWRELKEYNVSGKMDVTKDFKLFGNNGLLKFGGTQMYKQRSFNIRSFFVNVRNMELTGDPDELFAPENLWPYNGDVTKGITFEAPFMPVNPNRFESSVASSGAYALTEIAPFKKFRVIAGVRAEYYSQRYTGQDQLGTNVLNNEKVLNDFDLFPSVNLIYGINDKQNLRFSYGKTIARPTFKEMSYSEIFDPITGRTFIGGMFRDANDAIGVEYWSGQLVSTDIHSFDLRWEIFQNFGQTVAVSFFYKNFQRPIEIVQFATQAGSFQPRNVGNGQVGGIELEIRQSFNFLSESLRDLKFLFNATVAKSQIELSATEYNSRLENARDGQEIKKYRDMAGQAPWIINGGFEYSGSNGFAKGMEAGIYYNVQEKTLLYSGITNNPDVYSVPFHDLSASLAKKFGKDNRFNVGVKISNLLNDKREAVYSAYQATDQYFFSLRQGTTVSVKFGVNF